MAGDTYKHIKDNLCFENYLHFNYEYFGASVTKNILSLHLFDTERGRRGNSRIPVVNHACTSCNVIEDESTMH